MATKISYYISSIYGYTYAYNVPNDVAAIANIFTIDTAYDVEYVVLLAQKGYNTPTTVTVDIYSTSDGDPNSSLGSKTVDASGWSTSGVEHTITFDELISLESGIYAIVITEAVERSVRFGLSTPGAGNGIAKKKKISDGLWLNSCIPDCTFYHEVWASDPVPSKPTNPTPTNNDTEVDFSGLQLSWEDGGGADTYDIYIGKTGDLDLVSSTQEGVTYTTTLSELATIFGADPIDQKIYWRVDAVNDAGTTAGDEWNFDPRPGKVDTTTPTHEASGVTLDDTTGSWDAPSDNTDSYDVYYGTLSGFLSLLGNTAELTYSLRSTNWPQYGEAYYWRVDATNDFGTTQGDELDFTTLIFYPPTPSGVTWDDPGNDTGYTGTPLGTNNMLTVRKLCAAAENTFYYESA